ncbi:hypothetical protein SOCE26_094460 [Sorangium cellulosum]|uniref:Uncharacterized protein n=1 Tax=Sorangium cellulosum TaxID=56 RepID=A0A2L0F8L7_SORCE|nr:hypothetical protein [Sorangium cellulosum]AUX47920.1 hypothetical protein SOCE26_094460 [Sorangium cellulosum]
MVTSAWIRRGLVLAALVGQAGCSTQLVSLNEGPREYVATDYEYVLRAWTRTEHLIALSELDNFLTATATFESWDFRWAYVVRYAQDYRLTIEQRQKLLEKTLEETHQRHQFFVAIFGGERKYNDLATQDSAWIVRLIDDTGNETAPEEIIAITKPNALERTYFPYNTVWRRAFRIRFPRETAQGRPTISPNAKWFGLRFAGAQGNSELVWQLNDDEEPAEPVDVDQVAARRLRPVADR